MLPNAVLPRPPPRPPSPPRKPPSPPKPPAPTLANTALAIFNAVNTLRAAAGLGAVPYSRSLQIVADTHVADLVTNFFTGPASSCDAHSWFSGPFAW